MNKRTREIVALLLLTVLGLVVLAAMAWYIFIGHNWNVAASNIDESIGQMDGYNVILFEGEALPQTEIDRISMSQPLLDDENRGNLKSKGDEVEPNEPVSIEAAASEYRQKGATVFKLHPETPEVYSPPVVLNKNGLTIGVFYADGSMSRLTAQVIAADLKVRGVDFVITIVDDVRLLDIPASSVDIVICNVDEDIPSHGEYHGNAFCVQSPLVGTVQTLIIAPSRVITSKTITWL